MNSEEMVNAESAHEDVETLKVTAHVLRHIPGGNVPPTVVVDCPLNATVGDLIDILCERYGEELRKAILDRDVATMVNGVGYMNALDVPLRTGDETSAEVWFCFIFSSGG